MPSLLEALESKYYSDCEVESGCAGVTIGPSDKRTVSIFIPRLTPRQTVPDLLVLNDCDIDCAGDTDTIREKCQRVRELDLAQNKLQDWQEVFHILEQMPRIQFLNLSKNQLRGSISRLNAPTITNLKSMVLNGTYLQWSCIDVLLANLPVLEELHLSLNNYKEVLIDTVDVDKENKCAVVVASTKNCDSRLGVAADEKSPAAGAASCSCSCNEANFRKISAHQSLRTLHFTGNPIESWEEICRLGRVFPSLENLVLAECPIKTLCRTCSCHSDASADQLAPNNNDEDSPYQHFLNLLFLNLSYASIETWDDIDKLAEFPKLKHLRVKNWPLWDRVECTEHERRQLLIARLPNVSLLNGGGTISNDEREDAERAFIRYYMHKPESERPKRYNELTAKHGQLDPLVNINLKPDKRVKVLLTFGESTQPRLLDIYRTVFDLKLKLEKIVGLPANKMRLFYVDQDFKGLGPEEMKYPNKLLYSYNIQPGDEIIIDEKK